MSKTKTKRMERAVLVYQAGIANVFQVTCFNLGPFGRDARLLLQSDFRTCESFARGLVAAGVRVTSMHCNECGDIAERTWSEDLDSAPFHQDQHPVFQMTVSQ